MLLWQPRLGWWMLVCKSLCFENCKVDTISDSVDLIVDLADNNLAAAAADETRDALRAANKISFNLEMSSASDTLLSGVEIKEKIIFSKWFKLSVYLQQPTLTVARAAQFKTNICLKALSQHMQQSDYLLLYQNGQCQILCFCWGAELYQHRPRIVLESSLCCDSKYWDLYFASNWFMENVAATIDYDITNDITAAADVWMSSDADQVVESDAACHQWIVGRY